MRAHFAIDVVSEEESSDKTEAPLEARIEGFKKDSGKMEVLEEFVDDVLQKAEKEAAKKQEEAAKTNGKSQETKEKIKQNFKNGKVVNRARGLVVRIFDAICNCANSAAAPAQRIKLRGKRAAAAAAAGKNAANKKDEEAAPPQPEKLEQHQQQPEPEESSSKPEQTVEPKMVVAAGEEQK